MLINIPNLIQWPILNSAKREAVEQSPENAD